MKKKLLIKLSLSFLLGLLITGASFYFFKGDCSSSYMTLKDANISWYETNFCDNFDADENIAGAPLPFIKETSGCKGICPMFPVGEQLRSEILWTNLIIDVTVWAMLVFGIINFSNKLTKRNGKNE